MRYERRHAVVSVLAVICLAMPARILHAQQGAPRPDGYQYYRPSECVEAAKRNEAFSWRAREDTARYAEAADTLSDIARQAARDCLARLDLSAVPFMDSSGMNVLLWAYQQVRGLGGSVHVVSPTPAVRRVLELTGVSLTVPVSESLDEALARVARQREDRTESPA